MNRPTFEQLKARISADLSALPAVLVEVLAATWARVLHLFWAFLQWIDAQNSPLTCTLERLADWANLYSVGRLDAVAATGNLTVTGNIGAVVLKDAIFRSDAGLDYIVTTAVTFLTANATVPVRCLTAGEVGNLGAGATLTLIDPLAGVVSAATVAVQGITGGAEQEGLEAWRLRVVDEWQVVTSRGARSGKPDDYRAWAKNAHPDVSGALVIPHGMGVGTVLVRLICNTLVDRSPTAAIITAVQAKYASIAPAGADWRVVAPIVRNVSVTIDLNAAVDNAVNRAEITAAIQALVNSEMSETSVLQMAELDAAIASVTTQYVRVAPLVDVAVAAGEVLVLSEVAFV